MMHERGRAITRVCFDASPSEEDLALLGSRERWLLYRSMVRSRLVKVVRTALPRSREARGEAAFDALIDQWLAASAPSTRYFWQVPLEFGHFVTPRLESSPSYVQELCRYELACWRVRQKPAPSPAVGDFSFERAAVVNPTLELITLSHPVHLRGPGEAEAPKETQLCVYRNRAHRAEALRLNPLAHALVEDWMVGSRTVAESVRSIATARSVTIDQPFVEKLGGLIADFLERGVLLGSRA